MSTESLSAKDAAELLIASLADKGDDVPPGWFTCRELAEARGITHSAMGRKLTQAVRAGDWERKDFNIMNGDGMHKTPHYRPKPMPHD